MPCHRGMKHGHPVKGVQKSLKKIKASSGTTAAALERYLEFEGMGHLIKKKK